MDARVFPNLAAYLEVLPQGIESYPECLAKGTLIRSALEGHPPTESWRSLPQPMLDAIAHPPMPTAWVSAVVSDAVAYAVCDTYYPTVQEVMEWTYKRAARTANSPMYRMLTSFVGRASFMRNAVRMHGMFQRGTDLSIDLRADGAKLVLTHPPHLHTRLNHLTNEPLFLAMLERFGGEIQFNMVESTPTGAVYQARWVR